MKVPRAVAVLLVVLATMCIFLVPCGPYQVTNVPTPGVAPELALVAPNGSMRKEDGKDCLGYCGAVTTGIQPPPTTTATGDYEVSDVHHTGNEDVRLDRDGLGSLFTVSYPGFEDIFADTTRTPASVQFLAGIIKEDKSPPYSFLKKKTDNQNSNNPHNLKFEPKPTG